ncbi:MAG: YvcK family protein [Lachnospiraceae bacterium]|nr:YvcK family protein [Lachnospiraceae bacterium]
MFKAVIFGGGSGLSQLLKGMVNFPWDVTSVVSVSDNGKSTGALRKEFAIPAVGDITKVMMAMSKKPQAVKDLFMYRFDQNSSLKGHSIKNLIMTALLETEGDFTHSIPILAELLDIKGSIFPVTEDNVDLVGIKDDGTEIMGESQITEARSKIKALRYDKPVTANPRVLKALKEADLIIFSSGSLITSIMPHIIIPEIQEAVRKSKAKKLYVCNILTQPGETDDFTVSNHIDMLEKYLGRGTIDAVIANDKELPKDLRLFANSEGKDPVMIDGLELENRNIELIPDRIYSTEDGSIRHDSLKTAYLMFSYIMDQNK